MKKAFKMNPKVIKSAAMDVYAVRKLSNFILLYFCSQTEPLRNLSVQPCMYMQCGISQILYYYIFMKRELKMNP